MEVLSLGEKIKQKRKECGMTLKELAGEKVTPGQISLVESGKSKPSIDLLEYLAQKLNVSIDGLLETEEHQAEKLCAFYSKIADASILSGNYDQAIEAINKSMVYANKYNVEYYVGLNDFYMGKIHYMQGDYEESQSMLISANEVFFKTRKIKNQIDTYMLLGAVAYKLLYFNSSLNYYKQAEKVLNDNKVMDEDTLTRIYFNISLCHSKLDNYSSAIDYALLATEKFKQKNDKFQYGQSLLMLSISYNSLDRFEEALSYASEAVQVFKELDDQAFIAKMETNMGIILADTGNMDESFKHLQNAYRIKLEIKDNTLPYTMLRIADNYIHIKDFDKALEIIDEVYNKCCEEEHSVFRVTTYYYYYRLYSLKNDTQKAEIYLLEAARYLQNMGMPKELADIYVLLGEFYQNVGNQNEALKYMGKGIEIYKNTGTILKRSW